LSLFFFLPLLHGDYAASLGERLVQTKQSQSHNQ
jgi:hypothetical protein